MNRWVYLHQLHPFLTFESHPKFSLVHRLVPPLSYLTDVQGLKINGKLQSHLSMMQAKKLLSHKDVKAGMLPKLTCAVTAIKSGVTNVHIINGLIEHAVLLEMFTDQGIGTMISERLNLE